MPRYIDADKIIFHEIDEIGGEYEPYLGCSKKQIDDIETVDVIPREKVIKFISNIQKIKDEHNENGAPINYGTICGILIEGWKLVTSKGEWRW